MNFLLTKPFLAVILILTIALGGTGWYAKSLKSKADKLKAELSLRTSQLLSLNEQAKVQRDLHQSTLDALSAREMSQKVITQDNALLRQQLKDIIRDEEDSCLSSALPSSIINLLQLAPSKDSGSPSSGDNP